MWKCTKNEDHGKFSAIAHVTQSWVIDENNGFLECLNDAIETTHEPDRHDSVECHECGAKAVWCD